MQATFSLLKAIDRWFEDLSHYEQTLEEMAMVSLDHVFKDELSTIESWFRVLSEAERTAALYSLLQHSSQVQIRFFITVLQQMAKKDPVGALLSPTNDKDPVQSQLHGAMAKAEMEASQRLLNVLPIQPPAPPTLDRPVHRRLNDRHSVTMGESEEYNRMLRREFKRNSIDLLASRANKFNNNSTTAFGSNGSANGTLNGSGHPSNGNMNGIIGQYKAPSPNNRISTPNLFGGENIHGATNNGNTAGRPKSIHENDANTTSMFSSWNFASLGGTPLPSNTNMSGRTNNTGTSPATTSLAGSPGHIGDRSSIGRPKSVGGADWMLTGSLGQFSNRQSQQQQASGVDGLDASWNPLMKSPPTMGGFHNGTNGTGHGNFGNTSTKGSTSDMADRPKSVTEADLAKLNYNLSQWPPSGSHLPYHQNGTSSTHHFNTHNNMNGLNGPRLNNAIGTGVGSGTMSSLEETSMKLNNRRRTLLRPSAIMSNVPVTVLEGDEKLLSASANTSSINIVSSMFSENSQGTTASSMSPPTSGSMIHTNQYSTLSNSFSSQLPHFAQQQQQQQQQLLQQQLQQQQQQLHQQQALLQLQNRSFQPSSSSYVSQQHQPPQPQNRSFTTPPSSTLGETIFLQPTSHAQPQSPVLSPLPSPTRTGFRSRPASRSTSPVPSYPPKSFSAGHALLSTLNSTSSVLHHLQELELEDHLETDSGIGSGDGDGSSTTGSRSGSSGSIETIGRLNKKVSKSGDLASSPGSCALENAKIPMDYNEKRTMTPPPRDARPEQRTISSSLAALDDDYMSDTSDISNLGMNSSTRGRARAGTMNSKTSITCGEADSTGETGSGSAEEREGSNDNEGSITGSTSESKEKRPEGVDFELLQDTPAWLRSLRLHKYNNIFEGMQWRDIVNLSDGDLINKGVAALGARRKMLKVFEQVRKEMLLQGMVI
ncbi:hypothetical protein BGZ92_008342 [Podila epicladia]|nr:hypothetical protein BGZ92_008342 [Podila epicladia]